MSLHSHSQSANLAARHAHLIHAPGVENLHINLEGRTVAELHSRNSNDFADHIARQLPGVVARGSVALPVAKRVAKAFGKREEEQEQDLYEGPVDLEQDEFLPTVTHVRRQAPSNLPPTPLGWKNGDLGHVWARFANGTEAAVTIGNMMYAIAGSEESFGRKETTNSATGETVVTYVPLPQLNLTITTSDGSSTLQDGVKFALADKSGAYQELQYAVIRTAMNPGVPYMFAPIQEGQNVIPQYSYTINQQTGIITAIFAGSEQQFVENLNKVYYDAAQTINGNGDVELVPKGTAVPANRDPFTLFLSRTAAPWRKAA